MNRWDHFWLRDVPPHALALTRICLGAFLLVYAGLYAPHVTLLFSNEGIVLPLFADNVPAFALVLTPPSPLAAQMLFGLLMLAILCFTLGAFYRTATAVIIVLGLYEWQLQLHLFPASYNRILFFCLIVLLFSGAHRTLSADQWRRSGSVWDWEPISILPQRLIALQISATFFGVSMQKWWLPHWKGGEVLAYSFINRWGTPLARWYARLPLTLEHYDLVVLMVKTWQPIAAVALWFPKTRLASAVFLSAFILLVTVMMSIWWFVFIIPAFILFWSPEEILARCRACSRGRIAKKPVQPAK